MFVGHHHGRRFPDTGNPTTVDLCVRSINGLTALVNEFAGEHSSPNIKAKIISSLQRIFLNGSPTSTEMEIPTDMTREEFRKGILQKLNEVVGLIRALSEFSLVWNVSDNEFRYYRNGQKSDVGVIQFSCFLNDVPFRPELFLVLGMQTEGSLLLQLRSTHNWPFGSYVEIYRNKEELINFFHLGNEEFQQNSIKPTTEYQAYPGDSDEEDFDVLDVPETYDYWDQLVHFDFCFIWNWFCLTF